MMNRYASCLTLVVAAFVAKVSHAHRTTHWGDCKTTMPTFWSIRGGESSTEEELDKKVYAAMRKLGLSAPSSGEKEADEPVSENDGTPTLAKQSATTSQVKEGVHDMVDRISKDMHVDKNLVMAAVGATAHGVLENEPRYDEDAARSMIQQELDIIEQVSEDSEEVKQLVSEGYSSFLSRRALAFADMDMNNARAILIADQEDEEEEAAAAAAQSSVASQPFETAQTQVEKPASDLPTTFVQPKAAAPAPKPSMTPPVPAKKADVVFDAASSEIHKLVIESPVPLLLYVYADWCGPCKTLSPALEDMAVKAGGAFRLVKVNTDNERPISAALEVKALPTVFAVNKGKILNSFQGMPNSQEFMTNFMMGLLMPGAPFDPPVSGEDKEQYANLSSKLIKAAGTASFSFSQRERLQVRTSNELDDLVEASDMMDAGESAKVLRSLMSNIIRDPYEMKFRKVNLQNKVVASKIAAFPQCLAILKSVGFSQDGPSTLIKGKNKDVVNVAPLIVVRDYIDKWVDKNRSAIAKAERKRRDEIERSRLAAEQPPEEEEEEVEEADETDKNACKLKLRVEGRNKVIESTLDGIEPLYAVLDLLPISPKDGEEIQLTCIAKRLVVKSTDEDSMKKSLRDHGLLPAAFIVAKVIGDTDRLAPSSGSMLAERAAATKNRKKGSHTMQSIGIYAKDDNNKGELIDGGGGTLFEHDVTDDESEGEVEPSGEDEPTKGDDAGQSSEEDTGSPDADAQ